MSKSNLAVLMNLYNVTPQMLNQAVGADITLISRWRTGGRRLVPGRRWERDIAAWFVSLDARAGEGDLHNLLLIFYPADDLSSPEALGATLEKWLSARGQCEGDYNERRDRQLELLHDGAAINQIIEAKAPFVTYGEKDTHLAILDMLDKAYDLPRPCDIRFVCPEGLALLTRDADFGAKMMDKLVRLFERGFHLHVVLTVDYKMSEVSAFSGRWLAAHLTGYVRSYYNNDFFAPHDVLMMAVFEDKIALRVLGDEKHGVRSEFYYSLPVIKTFAREITGYFNASSMRFHYDFFPRPEGFLAKGAAEILSDCFLITRLPHLGVRGRQLLDLLNLSPQEAEHFESQFSVMLTCPQDLAPGDSFYHILCPEAIERALDKPRHRVPPAGEMFSRRVYMTTQALVDQLAAMRRMLKSQPNYHVCFLPESYFEQIHMELAVYGKQAAVGWIAGESSTACKDPTHVAILQGFAAVLWSRIPGMAKSRGAAAKRLGAWLKRARNFGYHVEE